MLWADKVLMGLLAVSCEISFHEKIVFTQSKVKKKTQFCFGAQDCDVHSIPGRQGL